MAEFHNLLGSVTFRISQEDFLHYNAYVSKNINKARAKKNTIMGIVEAVVAVLYMVAILVFSPDDINWLLVALAVVLLGLGVFNILFYPVLFPKKLQKAADKAYQKSRYMQNPITLNFYENGFEERSAEIDGDVEWKECEGLLEEEGMFLLHLSHNRCVIVPVHAISEEEAGMVRQIFEKVRPLIKTA